MTDLSRYCGLAITEWWL